MTHPYYVAMARLAMARLHGDPDNSAALAQWAESVRDREPSDRPHGIIVAADGTLVAEARGNEIGEVYVSRVFDARATHLLRLEHQLARAAATAALGQKCVYIGCGWLGGSIEHARAEARRLGVVI